MALAAISASLHPGGWTKGEGTEENLRSFNQWFEAYGRWTNVCMKGIDLDITQKWDLFVATGGTDLHDVVKEAGIVMEQREAVDFQAAVQAVPAGPNGNDPAPVDAVPEVRAVEAIVATPWQAGIAMVRAVINKYGIPISQRHILMTKMPSTDYSDWRTWGQRLKEQAKRCEWGEAYTWEVAALDALLYQCPDSLGGWISRRRSTTGVDTLVPKNKAPRSGTARLTRPIRGTRWP